ncbi:hypothetical protein ACMD2_10227 [Ananas comosus]|uniref:DUF8003 domain-containing protein n=1 Tax=Ananas comosus TaxID=4615 RepID=A0A199UM43_ANACO|nr:hypothetical protein ACMD2_10227 [Ananas comosus]
MVMPSELKHGNFFRFSTPGLLFIFTLLVKSFASLSDKYLGLVLDENYGGKESIYFEELSCKTFLGNSLSCEDLNGIGSFNTTCRLSSSLYLDNDLCIYGNGNVEISSRVKIMCPVKGCSITVNVSGNIKIGAHAEIIAGSVSFDATDVMLDHHSTINTTSLGGPPPSQTSGTPIGHDGAGGGHGGRGASCVKSNKTNWGGDVYAWSTLSHPWSYGSKGGNSSLENQYGGDGGGRVMLKVDKSLLIDGSILAEGGAGGLNGGGGSGGSIIIHAFKLTGNGTISAAGGNGWGGGGGGRISVDCYSIQQDVTITVHGGESFGCPDNGGAAGTVYDRSLQTLKVSNNNFTTRTETPLLDFPVTILWSNVYVESNARALVPLLWSRVQVKGQIKLLDGGSICFGLSEYPVSEFELVAEELLMSDSVIKASFFADNFLITWYIVYRLNIYAPYVYGAFRMYVKMLLMWDSTIQIDGGGNSDVSTSMLEARNLVVLRHNSVISSNADLGVYGQGLLNLSGPGDGIRAQRLFLSLFYNIEVGPGSLLQAPINDEVESNLFDQSRCKSQTCPNELIMPPDDCHVNSSLSFTLQICRVEDITVSGVVKGSIIHIHRARTVNIKKYGTISASELGCKEGIGEGKFLIHGAGGGAGHGGKGGSGFYNGMLIDGGPEYGDADLPCELGSGSVGPSDSAENVVGGGMIVMGSMKWPLSRLEIYGSLMADGQSHGKTDIKSNGTQNGGLGGGSGGTILLFLQSLILEQNSSLSVAGGTGGPTGGGGGGGGRIHFDWSNIAVGDEYVQIASVNGTIISSGGAGNGGGYYGGEGSITGKTCPKGLYGTFCNECPIGTYKDTVGSNSSLCIPCSLDILPNRADFIYVRGGVTQPSCPYRCLSEKYRMPKCYTPLEELVYAFGGPWPFAILLSFILILLALILSALRIKIGKNDYSYQSTNSIQHDGSDSFPYLLSLAEVPGTSRAEETQSHAHRMYFMGPNTFREPWHLPYSPPDAIIGIVYEDAFNRFIDEINLIAAYEWWEGSVHSILSVLAYPCAWSWKQWRRRKKIHRLQEYVKSKYDHSCLRSCRSRALYKGMKITNIRLLNIQVGSTPDLMVAYIDFFLGGDEKRLDVASTIQKRFPMCIIFGGDGSYMAPYYLHSDTLLTNLLGQYVSTAIWKRLVAGLNGQLRTVTQRSIQSGLVPVISWINSHGNPQLEYHGVRVELGWFQATASGYYQLGIVVSVNEYLFNNANQSENPSSSDRSRRNVAVRHGCPKQLQHIQASINYATSRKRLTGGIMAVVCGLIYCGLSSSEMTSNLIREDNEWWILPIVLLLVKSLQAGLVNWHVANIEIQDLSLFSPNPDKFWAM